MRIVILANADIGLYKFRKELVETLCQHCEVYIVLPKGEYIGQLETIGCKFVQFEFKRRGKNPFEDLMQIYRYEKVLKQLAPDVVLTYTIKPNIYGGIACQKCNVPYIANITGLGTIIENGGLLSTVSKFLYRIGLKKAACVFFQNKSNEELFVQKKITRKKTRVIPGSGVNLKMHNSETYSCGDDEFRFLFVGRIMKDKGIEELVFAVKKLREEIPRVVLDIVGWCDENYSYLLDEIEKAGVVRNHGLQKDVHPFYKNCHCVVLPSYHEGTANVLLEASATARPVIATRIPGCQETFEESITGFGCDVKDGDSLYLAMRKMVMLSDEQRAEMGAQARKKMEREYNRQIVIDAYLEEIEKTQR